MHQVEVNWTTLAGSATSVLHFPQSTPIEDARTALSTFLTAVQLVCATSTDWSIAQEGPDIDPADGSLLGLWSDPTPLEGSGTGVDQVADATQVLIRWRTSTVRGNRIVQGRTFIPGISSEAVDGGNLVAGRVSSIAQAGTAFIVGGNGPSVWARPSDTLGPGVDALVTQCGVWSEFAVQRGRRG